MGAGKLKRKFSETDELPAPPASTTRAASTTPASVEERPTPRPPPLDLRPEYWPAPAAPAALDIEYSHFRLPMSLRQAMGFHKRKKHGADKESFQFQAPGEVFLQHFDGSSYKAYVKPPQECQEKYHFGGVSWANVCDAEPLAAVSAQLLAELQGKQLIQYGACNDNRALNLDESLTAGAIDVKDYGICRTGSRGQQTHAKSLKDVAQQLLNRKIQRPNRPHSAQEDASAILDIYRIVLRGIGSTWDLLTGILDTIEKFKQLTGSQGGAWSDENIQKSWEFAQKIGAEAHKYTLHYRRA